MNDLARYAHYVSLQRYLSDLQRQAYADPPLANRPAADPAKPRIRTIAAWARQATRRIRPTWRPKWPRDHSSGDRMLAP